MTKKLLKVILSPKQRNTNLLSIFQFPQFLLFQESNKESDVVWRAGRHGNFTENLQESRSACAARV